MCTKTTSNAVGKLQRALVSAIDAYRKLKHDEQQNAAPADDVHDGAPRHGVRLAVKSI